MPCQTRDIRWTCAIVNDNSIQQITYLYNPQYGGILSKQNSRHCAEMPRIYMKTMIIISCMFKSCDPLSINYNNLYSNAWCFWIASFIFSCKLYFSSCALRKFFCKFSHIPYSTKLWRSKTLADPPIQTFWRKKLWRMVTIIYSN